MLLDEPAVPNRNDYDEVKQAYERYLYDLDEWARENYQEAVDELDALTDDLEAQEYPELGMHRLKDEQVRDESGDKIIAIQEQLREAIEWCKKLERIEDAFGSKD